MREQSNDWRKGEDLELSDFGTYPLIEVIKSFFDHEKERDVHELLILTKQDYMETDDDYNIRFWRGIK